MSILIWFNFVSTDYPPETMNVKMQCFHIWKFVPLLSRDGMLYSLLDACFICPVVVDTDADCVGLEGPVDVELGLDMMLLYLMYSFIQVYASV